MKHIRISIAALLTAWTFAAAASSAVAQPTTSATPVTISKSAIKKVRLQAPVGKSMDVAVIDQAGALLYQGTLQAQDRRGVLINLVNLPDGRYYITATNNDIWMSQGISVRNDQVSIDAQNVTELVRPSLVAYAKNKFEMAMPGVKNLSVAIYDRTNDLVFTREFKEGDVHRFDLSALPSGDYTFIYGPQQKQFTEHVAIK